MEKGFKQEAPLKGSPIEGAKSKDSLLDSDKGEAIQAEALQIKYEIERQAVASSPNVNLECMGKRVQKVGYLIVKDPSNPLQTKKKTKLPEIIGQNLTKLAYQEFVKKYPVEVFNSFQCPQNVDPLLFSQLCVYFYTDVRHAVVNDVIEGDCVYTKSITTNLDGEVVY